MPTDLVHLIGIAAPAEEIYRAITTEDGIRAWWTTAVKMDDKAGGMAVFSFFELTTVFQMRIEQLTPPSLVRWKCTGGQLAGLGRHGHGPEVVDAAQGSR
jgi:uncharacterized protein YndB with AHSA1/START domain